MSGSEPAAPSPLRRRRRRLAALVVGLSLAVTLGVAEWALRLALPELPDALFLYMHQEIKARSPAAMKRVRTLNPWIEGRAVHPTVHWTFLPNYPNRGKNEEGDPFELFTSAEGFYTPDVPAPGALQLVTLGDSFLSTFYVTRPIPYVIRDTLDLPVYNLAVGGWGPDQYLAAYETYCAERRARLVIICTFNNDIYDVDNVRRWRASNTEIGFQDWLAVNSEQWLNRGARLLDRRSVLYNTLKWGLLASWRQASTGGPMVGPALEPFGEGERAFELNLATAYQFLECRPEDYEPGGSYAGVLEPYLESLAALDAAIRAKGDRALFVWIPSKERVYIPQLPPERRSKYIQARVGEDIGGLERRLAAWAARAGIDLYDPTPQLEARAGRGEKLYFTQDGHLNSHGNQVVGELIAAAAAERLESR